MGFETDEAAIPEVFVIFEPSIDAFERLRIEFAHARRSLRRVFHELSLAQDAQVFGDRRAARVKVGSQISHRTAAVAQDVQDFAPRGVG